MFWSKKKMCQRTTFHILPNCIFLKYQYKQIWPLAYSSCSPVSWLCHSKEPVSLEDASLYWGSTLVAIRQNWLRIAKEEGKTSTTLSPCLSWVTRCPLLVKSVTFIPLHISKHCSLWVQGIGTTYENPVQPYAFKLKQIQERFLLQS